MAASGSILLSCNRSRFVEFGGDVELNRQWAYSLLSGANILILYITATRAAFEVDTGRNG